MKKLIASQSKKNAEKARRRLEGSRVTISIPGVLQGEISGAQALMEGHRLLSEARPEEALQIAQVLLTRVDDLVDIYLLQARALLELEAVYELNLLINPLVEAAGSNQGVLMVAARYYYLLGEAAQSLAYAKKAASNDVSNVEALMHMELCYRYSGDTDKARRILDRCFQLAGKKLKSAEEQFKLYSTALLRLANYAILNDQRYAELESLYASVDDQTLRTQSAYALAKQCNKRDDRESEIRYLCSANENESKLLGLEPRLKDIARSFQESVQRQRACFDAAKPGWMPDVIGSEHAPVFVLGLPRSGTTLLEQILGGHSAVGQVGESKAFLRALGKACKAGNPMWSHADYPARLDSLSADALGEMIRQFELHQEVLTDKLIYIDKELANFRYAGLMAALFPKAKFIHMDRAPMDIFLSCFRNSIPGVPESANLEAIAEYYVYMKKLIGHWRELFPDRLFIIDYQRLVHEPEKFARKAADFIGVDFEPVMLDFYSRKNIVRTLSVDQVRNKVYTSSVEAWRDYSEVLEPARKVLEKYDIPVTGVGYLSS